jgi:hypothetical protein
MYSNEGSKTYQSRVAEEQVARTSLEEPMGWRRSSKLNELNCNTRWCTKWQFQLDGQRYPVYWQFCVVILFFYYTQY